VPVALSKWRAQIAITHFDPQSTMNSTNDLPRLSDLKPLPPRPASLSMVRLVRCVAVAKGEFYSAHAFAMATYPHDKALQEVLKTAITSVNLGSAWGNQLTAARNIESNLSKRFGRRRLFCD
jgi:hypothetical protein